MALAGLAPARRAHRTQLLRRAAPQVAATVKATKEKMMRTEWTKIDADGLDAMVEGVGTGRDFLNSLSAEETNAVRARTLHTPGSGAPSLPCARAR
jgi:hypothetical protein